MSLRHRLDCLLDFVILILLCLLPLPNCVFRVCFPTLFAAVLKDFLPLIFSPILCAANSNKSAPMRLWMTYLRKKELQFSQKLVKEPQIPLLSVFQPFYSTKILFVLKQPSCSIVCVRNECWTTF